MFKGAAVPEGSASDLSTPARIRDAAIVVFGDEGFGVGVRAIAKAAGVSPGLVNHHFGSKDGLREVCDDHVRSIIRAAKVEYLQQSAPNATLRALADIEEFAPYTAYLMRSFQAGGALMTTLFDQMREDVETYLEVGIAAGKLRRPTDIAATAHYMAIQNGGGFFFYLQLYAARHEGQLDFRKALREYADQMILPAFEIYTNGLFTDSTALDDLLAER